MIKLLAVLVLIVLAYLLGILVMIYGWGLAPASWPWVIGGALGSLSLYTLVTALKND